MPTESGFKKEVTSGSVQLNLGSDWLVTIPIPTASAKSDEAVPIIEEVYAVVIRHYFKTKNLNPSDVVRCLRSVAEAIERNQQRITVEKYNGKRPRNG